MSILSRRVIVLVTGSVVMVALFVFLGSQINSTRQRKTPPTVEEEQSPMGAPTPASQDSSSPTTSQPASSTTQGAQSAPSSSSPFVTSPPPSSTSTLPSPPPPAQQGETVTIMNFAFSPSDVTVQKGAQILFTNQDNAAHTATADDGSFDTGLITQGQSKTITFSTAGTFLYHCTPHPWMTGTITVQ